MVPKKILVIKHGALGDIIYSLGAFKAIRQHHIHDHVVLLTAPAYISLAEKTGYFNEVWADPRYRLWKHPLQLFRLCLKLLRFGFNRIYDLQRSKRARWYFKLFKKFGRPPPEWSGVFKGASHAYRNHDIYHMHVSDRHAVQLGLVDIHNVPTPDFSWNHPDITHFNLPQKFFLLVPGCSPSRAHKRWPVARFIAVAQWLINKGYTPVLLGTKDEAAEIQTILEAAPECVSLMGKTKLLDIPEIAKKAAGALGGDTGPMQMIGVAGCPSVFLLSYSTVAAHSIPLGEHVTFLQRDDLGTLGTNEVLEALSLRHSRA